MGIASADGLSVRLVPVDRPSARFRVAVVHDRLVEAEGGGLLRRREGIAPGWSVTPPGRALADRFATEAYASPLTARRLDALYERFLPLNSAALAAFSSWQVRTVGAGAVRNDHTDSEYDAAVRATLIELCETAEAIAAEAADIVPRMAHYTSRLGAARRRIIEGDHTYIARPVVDSMHTVWFEWHEDLLRSRGTSRNAETRMVD